MKKFMIFSVFFILQAVLPLAAELQTPGTESTIRGLETRCNPCHHHKHRRCDCPPGATGATGATGSTGTNGTTNLTCFGSFYTQYDTSSPDEFGQVLPGFCVPLNLTQINVGGFIPVLKNNGDDPPDRGETIRAWRIPAGCEGVYHITWGVSASNTGTEVALSINGNPVQSTEIDTGAGNQTTTYASILSLNLNDEICIENVGEGGSSTLELGSATGTARGDNNTAFLVIMKIHDPLQQ